MAGSPAPSSWEEALAFYNAVFLPQANLSRRTQREYSCDMRDLARFLQERWRLSGPARVVLRHLVTYLDSLERRGFAVSTRRRRVAAIRSFFHALSACGGLPELPGATFSPPERDNLPPRILHDEEYRRLLLLSGGEVRDHAIIALLLCTGLRLSELARLTLDCLYLPEDEGARGTVYVRGSGAKAREVPVDRVGRQALGAYLRMRPPAPGEGRLFLSLAGRAITPRAIENVVSKYLEVASVPGASVHTLRHTFAVGQVRAGLTPEALRQFLGHESVETVLVYFERAIQTAPS